MTANGVSHSLFFYILFECTYALYNNAAIDDSHHLITPVLKDPPPPPFDIDMALPSTLLAIFAPALTVNTPRPLLSKSSLICSACLARQRQPRRFLSAAPQYSPHTLNPTLPPPPPRNTNIPDTSIASNTPEIDNARPPRIADPKENAWTKDQPEKQSISVSEGEAQKSKPITSASDPIDKPKRPSRLRPRKAAMNLTPSATDQLRTLLSQPEPKLIRVGVKNRGCSGLAYHLEYVEKPGAFDETVEQDGVKVLIDSKALFSIIGSEMDWVEDRLNQRFVFRNPNISESLYPPIQLVISDSL